MFLKSSCTSSIPPMHTSIDRERRCLTMKKFEMPEIEIIKFSTEDVLSTSSEWTKLNELPLTEFE